jgi:signal transduction histidine kinase
MTSTMIDSEDVIIFIIAGILVIALMFGFILHFLISYKSKKRDYSLLEKQKKELDEQKRLLENTLEELKSAQSQLVHAEKMASLGELTAGIAHEIQNPLNFVNNFSEVSKELLIEMKEEVTNNRMEDAFEIADDIIQNLEKINYHGKRADAIVKGMLQHSRSSKGLLELTDINNLCDECIRLAYHGLKAKNMDFNVGITTDFDKDIVKINIIPQEIGRVILNILTNAFYAANQKAKREIPGFTPTIKVTTQVQPAGVNILIRDNGDGIPESVLDKIFQPFFTSKPTGQGTGLGLSISLDIIKSHGGRINIDTLEDNFTEFCIFLPSKS